MKIDIENIKLDLEKEREKDKILLKTLAKYSIRQIEKEYFKHLNLKK